MDILTLDDERIEELERLSALGYSSEEIAVYFDVDKIFFVQAAEDPTSRINYHIRRGKLMSLAKEQMALLGDAEKGNVTASQQLANIRRTRGWQVSKLDVFGGFEDRAIIRRLQDYIESGSLNQLSSEEAIYLDALTLMNSMYRKYGRRNTVLFFTRAPWNLKHTRASDMLDEALNLFFTDRNIDRKALRNLFAENLQEAARQVRDNALSSKDWEIYGKLTMQAAKLLELDKEEKDQLPAEIYLKPLRIYSLNPEAVGLPEINRQDLANQIEALEIPERDKLRLKVDARLESLKLEERIHELEEKAKGE